MRKCLIAYLLQNSVCCDGGGVEVEGVVEVGEITRQREDSSRPPVAVATSAQPQLSHWGCLTRLTWRTSTTPQSSRIKPALLRWANSTERGDDVMLVRTWGSWPLSRSSATSPSWWGRPGSRSVRLRRSWLPGAGEKIGVIMRIAASKCHMEGLEMLCVVCLQTQCLSLS